jgi:SNF2 family DNA or RNA helicase
VDVEESVKIDAAMDLLDEVISDEKVVMFSQFKAPLRELAKRIKKAGYSVATIDGDTPVAERADIIAKFQEKPLHDPEGIDIVLGNFKAMGIGVTLTAASQMIIIDEEWSPGKNEQAYDRIYRIGQEKPVTINILRVGQTVDTWMAGLIEEKANMVDGFIGAADLQQRLREAILNGEF